jgi:hypothetical protein
MKKKPVKAATRHARAKKAGLSAWGGYEAQLLRQGGGCAVCGKRPGDVRLHVDHNHLTGECRGLICWCCNATIGRARDDWRRLNTAGLYLKYGWAAAVAYRDALYAPKP